MRLVFWFLAVLNLAGAALNLGLFYMHPANLVIGLVNGGIFAFYSALLVKTA